MKKKKKLTDDNTEMSLQITSMADIFTIILVFLLKSFATSAISLTPSANLPQAKKLDKKPLDDALVIEVSKNTLLIDQKPLMKLINFLGESSLTQALDPNGKTSITKNLLQALAQEKKKSQKNTKAMNKITLIADQLTPYQTLNEIIQCASIAGYSKLQLIMVKDE